MIKVDVKVKRDKYLKIEGALCIICAGKQTSGSMQDASSQGCDMTE
jgi:hypothetical protein